MSKKRFSAIAHDLQAIDLGVLFLDRGKAFLLAWQLFLRVSICSFPNQAVSP